MKTPKEKNSNAPQNVLKSIEPKEELTIGITKTSGTKELNSILTGISAFIDRLDEKSKYKINVSISKIIEDVSENGESDLSTN